MIQTPCEIAAIIGAISDGGGRPYLVGGCVRDAILGRGPSDWDIEVFKMSPCDLDRTLCSIPGVRVSLVGKQFGVYDVHPGGPGVRCQVSLPRRERKTGDDHRDFDVGIDPDLPVEVAASRRDFTINAMMYNPITGEFADPYRGERDLHDRVLRHTSDRFSEDPLRVLRGMQFCGRFGLRSDNDTTRLCKGLLHDYPTIPIERVSMEWWKWATMSRVPSYGLDFLEETAWITHYPPLFNTLNTHQDPFYHPEGDLSRHIKLVCNASARIANREEMQGEDRAVLMFAALCHDLGKPETTVVDGDRVRSPAHAEHGVPIAREFLGWGIGCPRHVVDRVLPLVREHMIDVGGGLSRRARNRLLMRLRPATPRELYFLMESDNSGRPPLPPGPRGGSEQLLEMDAELPAEIEPILKGRHLIARGMGPGKAMGVYLKRAFEAQIDAEFDDEVGAIAWVESNPPECDPPGSFPE